MEAIIMAAAVKHSKQRDAIEAYLKSTYDHPTADIVYQNVSKEFPNISLGTIYRNLAFLVDHGKAITIPCEDGSVHYDANLKPHNHFQCNKCHAVMDFDLNDEVVEDAFINNAQSHFSKGKISGHITFFHGICNNCDTD